MKKSLTMSRERYVSQIFRCLGLETQDQDQTLIIKTESKSKTVKILS